ncbi:hypothetical protein ACOSQ2_017634 [Xanthoceras sorbifolium]
MKIVRSSNINHFYKLLKMLYFYRLLKIWTVEAKFTPCACRPHPTWVPLLCFCSLSFFLHFSPSLSLRCLGDPDLAPFFLLCSAGGSPWRVWFLVFSSSDLQVGGVRSGFRNCPRCAGVSSGLRAALGVQ